jgi:PTS system nitrogen regulatory IIA component
MQDYIAGGTRKCLPQILRDSGYQTVYAQSSPMQFMSFDSFMPKAGFAQVYGADYFSRSYARNAWGIDDRAFFEQSAGLSQADVAASLAAREKLGSTGLGQGIAIPHGRIHGLREAVGAYARLRSPVPFDAPDAKPVEQLFVLLVPEQATDQHLQLLSELAQMFSDRMFREQLMTAPDAATVADIFRDWVPAG